MADIVSREKRSQMMAGIRSKNTKPEKLIRSILHKRGFRFRLHKSNLPGKPDLAFQKYKAVIFVNGCYFHGHDCHLFKLPSSNSDFWHEKISKNRLRDAVKICEINKLGWRVLTIWECSTRGKTRIDVSKLVENCIKWLVEGKKNADIRGL
jgi:DNA mismatch endonuclease (patch repair protein)